MIIYTCKQVCSQTEGEQLSGECFNLGKTEKEWWDSNSIVEHNLLFCLALLISVGRTPYMTKQQLLSHTHVLKRTRFLLTYRWQLRVRSSSLHHHRACSPSR